MKSGLLQEYYKLWQKDATPEQIAFVDEVYAMCEKHYNAGGDTIIECFEPKEILAQFKTLEQVKDYCGLKVEQATNFRWGEDTDPELERQRNFDNW